MLRAKPVYFCTTIALASEKHDLGIVYNIHNHPNSGEVESILSQYVPTYVLSFLTDEGAKVVPLPDGVTYARASTAIRRLAVRVDAWPVPPAGLFVVEERTVYLRTVSSMTVVHELGHALDCVLGGGVYRSSVDPVIRRAFESATQFVTPYAASSLDEFFAESWRAYLGANDAHSLWPKVTRARLHGRAPTMHALFEGNSIDVERPSARHVLPTPKVVRYRNAAIKRDGRHPVLPLRRLHSRVCKEIRDPLQAACDVEPVNSVCCSVVFSLTLGLISSRIKIRRGLNEATHHRSLGQRARVDPRQAASDQFPRQGINIKTVFEPTDARVIDAVAISLHEFIPCANDPPIRLVHADGWEPFQVPNDPSLDPTETEAVVGRAEVEKKVSVRTVDELESPCLALAANPEAPPLPRIAWIDPVAPIIVGGDRSWHGDDGSTLKLSRYRFDDAFRVCSEPFATVAVLDAGEQAVDISLDHPELLRLDRGQRP